MNGPEIGRPARCEEEWKDKWLDRKPETHIFISPVSQFFSCTCLTFTPPLTEGE
jgi:hypothetical protein